MLEFQKSGSHGPGANWLLPTFVLAGAAVITAALVLGVDDRRDLPRYWEAPSFTLVNQEGGLLATEELRGTVWVASFVFTNCADVCPLITARKARLRDALEEDGLLGSRVRLVSISVDPDRDTPEVLREYATRFGGLPPGDWAFLTGADPDEVERIVQGGFRLSVLAHRPDRMRHEPGENYQVMHSPRVVLVDRELWVRGTYDASDPDAFEDLDRDLRRLINRDKS